MIKPDRLKQRDDRYNTFHRHLGHLPSSDLDMIIYNGINPICILETKHFNAGGENLDLNSFQMQQQARVAELLFVPYLVVYYVPDATMPEVKPDDYGDFWEFRVFPRNGFALELLPREGKHLSAFEYCELLYKIKGTVAKPSPNLSKMKSDIMWSAVKTDW